MLLRSSSPFTTPRRRYSANDQYHSRQHHPHPNLPFASPAMYIRFWTLHSCEASSDAVFHRSCPNATFHFTTNTLGTDRKGATYRSSSRSRTFNVRSSSSASAETLRGPRDGNVSVTVQATGLEMCLGKEDEPFPESEVGICMSV